MLSGGGTREPITSPSSAMRRMIMFCASNASGDVAFVSTPTRLETSSAVSPGSTYAAPPLPVEIVAEYANCEAGAIGDVPDGVVTPILTVPLPGGLVATITVSPSTEMPVAAAPPKPADNAAQLNAGGVTWRWPADGKVVGTYVAGDQTKQGLDIAGSAGDAVRAAADGEVVYSGNGLIGYGELIIVKHNANFLSAYGHNRKRLVSEGERVKAGQEIAEMGSTSASRDELHFEIRKNGKPVNPLDYLPAK